MLSGKGIIVAVSPFLTYIATPPPRRSDRSCRKGGWKPAKLIKLDPSGVDEVESHVSVTHNMSMSWFAQSISKSSKRVAARMLRTLTWQMLSLLTLPIIEGWGCLLLQLHAAWSPVDAYPICGNGCCWMAFVVVGIRDWRKDTWCTVTVTVYWRDKRQAAIKKILLLCRAYSAGEADRTLALIQHLRNWVATSRCMVEPVEFECHDSQGKKKMVCEECVGLMDQRCSCNQICNLHRNRSSLSSPESACCSHRRTHAVHLKPSPFSFLLCCVKRAAFFSSKAQCVPCSKSRLKMPNQDNNETSSTAGKTLCFHQATTLVFNSRWRANVQLRRHCEYLWACSVLKE